MDLPFVISFHGDRDKLGESFLFALVMVPLCFPFPPVRSLPMARSISHTCAILVGINYGSCEFFFAYFVRCECIDVAINKNHMSRGTVLL
jgi:predicted membrane protein